ncbi:MAG TPA: LTA synthase family protein [Rhodanobacteraceae bacterium]|nr:LTA synthase family protein [Rhodanobacteraceae bacterium]
MGSHAPISSSRHPPVRRLAAVIVFALAFVLCTAWLDGGSGIAPTVLWNHPAWWPWWSAPLRMLGNALPGLLLAFGLFAWTRRAGWSFALAFGVQALVYGVNALKVKNLAIPLMPADFRMLGQLNHGGAELLSGYLPHLALLVVALLACIALLVAWFRLEPALLHRRPRRWRAAASGVLFAALVTLIAGVPFWRGLYSQKLLGMQPWSPLATRQHDGLVGSLMLFHLQYGEQHRKADVPAALALMARYEPRIAAQMHAVAGDAAQKPDIVVILSESFFDPTIMNGYPPGTDLTPDLHRLEQHGTSGWLHVPTFGGGTIRTGFEVLTGLSLRYFPEVQFPYLQIHEKQIPGIVRLLDGLGYATLAVHGNVPGFWNRTEAFKALGFDQFISIGDFPKGDSVNDGKYMSDKSFTDEVLRRLPDSGPPRFVFGISIEAHGPYDESPGIDTKVRDAIPVPTGVTDPHARLELQNYIYHMQHADRQLGRLVDTLAQRQRRTLVLFFGDHLPALVPAFQQAGFRNGQDFLTQTVPYLLIDTAHMDQASRRNAAAWELPGMVLQQADIGGDAWFALTRLVAPRLAALTRAPDAPVAPEDMQQKQLDEGMRNVADLRLRSKLDKLWPKAAALAQPTPTAPTVQSGIAPTATRDISAAAAARVLPRSTQ